MVCAAGDPRQTAPVTAPDAVASPLMHRRSRATLRAVNAHRAAASIVVAVVVAATAAACDFAPPALGPVGADPDGGGPADGSAGSDGGDDLDASATTDAAPADAC